MIHFCLIGEVVGGLWSFGLMGVKVFVVVVDYPGVD
jgi:hypothetical protein